MRQLKQHEALVLSVLRPATGLRDGGTQGMMLPEIQQLAGTTAIMDTLEVFMDQGLTEYALTSVGRPIASQICLTEEGLRVQAEYADNPELAQVDSVLDDPEPSNLELVSGAPAPKPRNKQPIEPNTAGSGVRPGASHPASKAKSPTPKKGSPVQRTPQASPSAPTA